MERKTWSPKLQKYEPSLPLVAECGYHSTQSQMFPTLANDPYAEFRECLKSRDFVREKIDPEKELYKFIEDKLMTETIAKSCGLITTLSKSADNKIKAAKKPVVAVINECALSTELETLLV